MSFISRSDCGATVVELRSSQFGTSVGASKVSSTVTGWLAAHLHVDGAAEVVLADAARRSWYRRWRRALPLPDHDAAGEIARDGRRAGRRAPDSSVPAAASSESRKRLGIEPLDLEAAVEPVVRVGLQATASFREDCR